MIYLFTLFFNKGKYVYRWLKMLELFFDRLNKSYVIKDGDGSLRLSEKDFENMRLRSESPLLRMLYDSARDEKSQRI